MTEHPALLIPRKLAQQLFHLAQQPDEDCVCGYLLQNADGQLQPVATGQADTRPENIPTGSQLYGYFQRLPLGQQQPTTVHSGLWQFTLSLDVKGVLQLQAWRGEGQPQEVPVRILAD